MDDKQLILLKQSIEHWRRLATGTARKGEGIGPAHCPLCLEFCLTYANACIGCPIYEKTEKKFCGGTPYSAAKDAIKMDGNWQDVFDDNFKAKAALELAFLESLLPNEK